MSNSDLRKIREVAQGHTVEPRPEAWDKLNAKLKTRKAKVRMISYRNISIAAILVSVLSVSVVFSMYLKDHDPDVFASNEQFRPIALEELEVDNLDPMFNLEHVSGLHNAYQGTSLINF